MSVQQLEFGPVKFGQHFWVSVKQFGRLLCQLVPFLQRQKTSPTLWCACSLRSPAFLPSKKNLTHELKKKKKCLAFSLSWDFTARVEGSVDFECLAFSPSLQKPFAWLLHGATYIHERALVADTEWKVHTLFKHSIQQCEATTVFCLQMQCH